MPPKVTTSRDMILDAAFEIVKEHGFNELSSRNIAKRLNCSISPIFTAYGKMSDLEIDVMKKGRDLLLDFTRRTYTDNVFLNQGVGIVMFARENREFYKEMFIDGSRFSDMLRDFGERMDDTTTEYPYLAQMNPEQVESVRTKMWIFTHGLAAMACSNLMGEISNDFIISTLNETGRAVLFDTLNREMMEKKFSK